MGLPLGSWTGRAGRAISAWTGHSFSANRRIEFGYQHLKIDGTFLPGGATQNRASIKATWQIRPHWLLEGYLQGEPTGQWDQSSLEALRRFQQDQNLQPSGKLDSLSLIALGLGPKHDNSVPATRVTPNQQ